MLLPLNRVLFLGNFFLVTLFIITFNAVAIAQSENSDDWFSKTCPQSPEIDENNYQKNNNSDDSSLENQDKPDQYLMVQEIELKLMPESGNLELVSEIRKEIIADFEVLKKEFLGEIYFPSSVAEETNTNTNPNHDIPFNANEIKLGENSGNHYHQLIEKIRKIYIDHGFLLNIVKGYRLDPIDVEAEVLSTQPQSYKLVVVVQEARLGRVTYQLPKVSRDGQSFINEDFLCDRLIHLLGGDNAVINYQNIEENLIYLKNDPLIDNIESYLIPAEGSYRALEILISAKNPQQGKIIFENITPASVGDQKFAISYTHNNLSNIGDRLNLGYMGTTTEGIRAFSINYEMPIGVAGDTLSFSFAPSWTRVTKEPFNKFDITARSQSYGIEYRHPLIQKPDKELALSFGFNFQNGRTFIFNDVPIAFSYGADDDGITRTSTFTFGQEYRYRTSAGAWSLSSELHFGTDLFNSTTNRWNEPGGFFSKWEGYLQRLQRVSTKHRLLAHLQWQLTPRTLASSQQISFGGMNTIRGYRANARTADNGVRFSLEDYITVNTNEVGQAIQEIVPFIDLGFVWNNPNTSNSLSDQRFLFSTGVSLRWYEFLGDENLSARLDFAYPLIKNKDRGDSLQDQGIYFSLGYTLD